jgi:uncharacterized protein YoxC
MKMYKYFVVLLTLMLFLSVNLFAQEEEEMTEEEWQGEITRLTEQKANLTQEMNTLKGDMDAMKSKMADMQSYEDCMKDLYNMVGATQSDVDAFNKQVAALAGKIERKESPKDDRQAELDDLKKNKISALPQFFDRVHNQLQRQLDSWVEKPKEIMYTVVRGDHLWGIAKKKEHYANPFAWPKIYQANRDQIKNPDLIYPAQVFKIPNLTEEEKAKYDKLRTNFKPAPPKQTP